MKKFKIVKESKITLYLPSTVVIKAESYGEAKMMAVDLILQEAMTDSTEIEILEVA